MIAQTIQLALTPVFVLVAIGNIMNILSQRLGRVVDRSRRLQERHGTTDGDEHDAIVSEMRLIAQRITLIGRALTLLVISGLTIGLTVAVLFFEELAKIDLHQVAATTFVIAIAMLMSALTYFLRETRVAAETLQIPLDYLELHRKI